MAKDIRNIPPSGLSVPEVMRTKFWADLQAWTQAQYEAMVRANRPAREQWSTADINRLLRDRLRDRPKAKLGRSLLPEFRRTQPRGGGNEIEASPLQLETGWLTWGEPATYPLRVYADQTLTQYLGGAGTPTPPNAPVRTEHLIGAAEITPSCPRWPTPPPALDGSSSYVSTVWAGSHPSGLGANWSSGLGILYWQVRDGGGGAPLPDGWPVDPTQIGMVRSPTWQYWLTWVSSSGCVLARLTVPASAACLRSWLMSGYVTGQDALLVEAWLVRALTLSDPADVVEVANAAAMSDMYANGAVHIAGWGWQWTYQPAGGNQDAQAIQVHVWSDGAGADYRTHSITGHIALAWDAAGWPKPATVDIDEASSWVHSQALVSIYLAGTASTYRLCIPSAAVATASGGVLAAWYTRAGAVRSISIGGTSSYSAGGVGDGSGWTALVNAAAFCGFGSAIVNATISESSGIATSATLGGSSFSLRLSGSRTTRSLEIEISEGTTGESSECYPQLPPGDPDQWNGTETHTCSGDHQIQICEPADRWTTHYADAVGGCFNDTTIDTGLSMSGGIQVVIGPPRCGWGRKSEQWGSGSTRRHTRTIGTYAQGIRADHTKGYVREALHSSGVFGGGAQTIDETTSLAGSTSSTAIAVADDMTASIDADTSWWGVLANTSLCESAEGITPDGVGSYGGLVAYTSVAGIPETWVLSEGLAVAAIGGPNYRWIGGI